jgi:Ca2+-binding RTX toxin-like protein
MSARRWIHRFDALEPRLLLASFASVNLAGVLSVAGTSQSNVISVAYSGSNVKVTRDGSSLYFAKSKAKAIWAEAYGGNDKITIGVALPATLIGDAGNDTLVGNSKDDEIHGGSGDDRLTGAGGSNTLDHGSGNDVIDYSAQKPGSFSIGLDGAGDDRFTETIGGKIVSQDAIGFDRVTILLTAGDDGFHAENIDLDWIVNTGAGNDSITVGFPELPGSIYRIDAGPGNDTLDFPTCGFTSLSGGAGNDVFFTGFWIGINSIDGGSGHDTCNIGDAYFPSAPQFDATIPAGVEVFEVDAVDAVNLVVHGNDLDNDITAHSINVTIYGNGGNDRLNVQADTPGGGYGGVGLADGGSGNDTLIGNHATVFKGGSGNDTADFSDRTDRLNISLDSKANDGAPGDNANVMSDVENVTGGSGNDKITGSSANNILHGGKGNDSLNGVGGADALFGDDGNDVLDGGTGNDYLQGWTGNDALFGRDGNDKLDAGDGNDYLEGNAGNDTLTGGGGRDKMYGNDGNDLLYAKDGKVDTLNGGNGTDTAQRDNSSTTKDSVLNIESFI